MPERVGLAHQIFPASTSSSAATSLNSRAAARTIGIASTAPRSFTEPHAEFQERPRLQRCQHQAVAAFRRAVSEDTIILHGGLHPDRDQRRRACDEAIDHDRPPPLRRAKDRARHHGDFQPAEFAEHIERGAGAGPRCGALERRVLPGHARVILPCARADAIDQRRRRQSMHQAAQPTRCCRSPSRRWR